jgi:hypothetical protein
MSAHHPIAFDFLTQRRGAWRVRVQDAGRVAAQVGDVEREPMTLGNMRQPGMRSRQQIALFEPMHVAKS